MSDIKNYQSEPVQRALSVIRLLSGKEINGLSKTEIANQLDISPATATRIMANLQLARFAEPLPSNKDRFRLSAAFVQIANTAAANFGIAKRQLDQDIHNFGILNV